MIEHTAPRFSVTEASLLAREHFGFGGLRYGIAESP